MSFVEVAKWSDLLEHVCIVKKVGMHSILLCRQGEEVYALENQCPHAGYGLGGGCFKNYVIRCPAHGHKFDVRTGFSIKNVDGFPIPCFPVQMRGRSIWVDLVRPFNFKRDRN